MGGNGRQWYVMGGKVMVIGGRGGNEVTGGNENEWDEMGSNGIL